MFSRARSKPKDGEITSPLITAILAARVARHRETERLFPGCARPIQFTERELKIVEQCLRLATQTIQKGGRV
jgi:hypothetical protein